MLTPIYLSDYTGQFILPPPRRKRSVGLTVLQEAPVPRSGLVQSGKSQPIRELVLEDRKAATDQLARLLATEQ